MAPIDRRSSELNLIPRRGKKEDSSMADDKTSIQLSTSTRDRLYQLKFRRTYDQFINELCDLYEQEMVKEDER
jgi:hypothetical protein